MPSPQFALSQAAKKLAAKLEALPWPLHINYMRDMRNFGTTTLPYTDTVVAEEMVHQPAAAGRLSGPFPGAPGD